MKKFLTLALLAFTLQGFGQYLALTDAQSGYGFVYVSDTGQAIEGYDIYDFNGPPGGNAINMKLSLKDTTLRTMFNGFDIINIENVDTVGNEIIYKSYDIDVYAFDTVLEIRRGDWISDYLVDRYTWEYKPHGGTWTPMMDDTCYIAHGLVNCKDFVSIPPTSSWNTIPIMQLRFTAIDSNAIANFNVQAWTQKGASVVLYPNPTSDLLNVNTSERVASIKVYNLSGNKVADVQNESKIQLSSLQAGTYIVHVHLKGNGKPVQFVISKN